MKFEDLLLRIRDRGYELELGNSISFEIGGEKFVVKADAIAKANGKRFILVKREEYARPLTPLERRTVAIARLFGVLGFAILTNEVEVVTLDVQTGERIDFDELPDANNANIVELDFDEERERRIIAAIGSIRCPCCEDKCTI